MGCGCGKSSKNSKFAGKVDKNKQLYLLAKANSLSKEQMKKLKKVEKASKTRLSICSSCPYSVQNERDKKYNIKICHKVNRPLSVIINDLSFVCPLGKFK